MAAIVGGLHSIANESFVVCLYEYQDINPPLLPTGPWPIPVYADARRAKVAMVSLGIANGLKQQTATLV
ncbi:MAG: hypothetical protein ACOYB1_12565 [Limnohabitans sp.]